MLYITSQEGSQIILNFIFMSLRPLSIFQYFNTFWHLLTTSNNYIYEFEAFIHFSLFQYLLTLSNNFNGAPLKLNVVVLMLEVVNQIFIASQGTKTYIFFNEHKITNNKVDWWQFHNNCSLWLLYDIFYLNTTVEQWAIWISKVSFIFKLFLWNKPLFS